MPINDPTGPQTAVDAPRLRVLSNGVALPGAISASCVNNNYYHSDTFTVEFALPAAGAPAWWDVDPPLIVDIQLSVDCGASWNSLLIGEADHVSVHPVTGLLQAEGRDLSARLIEAKTQEPFINQTASQVAASLAARHGLRANVAATTTLVGRYYEADHTRVTLGQFGRTTTEWDLLVYLAQREQFDVYMTGLTLNFQPIAPPTTEPYALVYVPPAPGQRFNAITFDLQRSLTIAKDVQVVVQSWSTKQGRGFSKTATAIGGKPAGAGGRIAKGASTTQKYVFVRPNLTEDQAQKAANQLAIDITKHERVVAVEMPGELVLTPRNLIKLSGTNTSFDQAYFIDHIDRSISFGEGFRQSLRLKNSSPRSMTQA
jgi:phage protein D